MLHAEVQLDQFDCFTEDFRPNILLDPQFMAALHESAATLRIGGDALKPDEVSRVLGCQPSFALAKGDIKPSKTRPILRKSGMWALEATKQEPANVDAQIEEIFSRLPADLAVWAR